MRQSFRADDALPIVDLQRGFLPGGGLATDYCVINTVLDARRENFEVSYVQDASKPVDVNTCSERAVTRMGEAGAVPIGLARVA